MTFITNSYRKVFFTVIWGIFFLIFWQARAETTLKVRLRTEPGNLQWVTQTDLDSFRVVRSLLKPLLTWDGKKILPGCAKDWKVAPAGLVYTFHMNSNCVWNDGTKVLASDFVRALEYIFEPTNGSPTASLFFGVMNQKSMKVISEDVLEISLPQKSDYFLSILVNLYPLHPKEDVKNSRYPKFTNGDFSIQEWKPESYLLLKRKISKKSYPDLIQFYFVDEDATAVRLYETRALDIVEYPGWFDLLRYEKKKKSEIFLLPTFKVTFLGLNQNHPKLKDLLLRRYLMSLLNKKELVQLRPQVWDFAMWVVPDDFLPEQKIQSATVVKKPENLPKLTLLIGNKDEHRLVAEWMQAQFKKGGVELKVWTMDWRAYLLQRKNPETELFLSSWSGSHPHAHSFLEIFLPGGPNDFVGIKDPRFPQWANGSKEDALLASRFITKDEAVIDPLFRERLALFLAPQFEGLWADQFGRIPYGEIRLKSK